MTPVSSMDTVPLICLHKSARRLTQAAVWMGGKRVAIPVKCVLMDAGAFSKVISKFLGLFPQMFPHSKHTHSSLVGLKVLAEL